MNDREKEVEAELQEIEKEIVKLEKEKAKVITTLVSKVRTSYEVLYGVIVKPESGSVASPKILCVCYTSSRANEIGSRGSAFTLINGFRWNVFVETLYIEKVSDELLANINRCPEGYPHSGDCFGYE